MKVTITKEFWLTPAEMAAEFWDMSNDEQAEFFFELSKLTTDYASADTQWCMVRKSLNSGPPEALACFQHMASWGKE